MKNKITIQFEHIGTFHDIPARYQSWQKGDALGDRIIFEQKHLKCIDPQTLLVQIQNSQLIKNSHRVIIRNHKKRTTINFNVNRGADH